MSVQCTFWMEQCPITVKSKGRLRGNKETQLYSFKAHNFSSYRKVNPGISRPFKVLLWGLLFPVQSSCASAMQNFEVVVHGPSSCFHAKPNQYFNQTNPGWPKPRHLVILDSSADRPKIFKWQLDLQTGSRLIQPLPWHDMSSTVWLQNSPFFKRRKYISTQSFLRGYPWQNSVRPGFCEIVEQTNLLPPFSHSPPFLI